MAEVYNTAQGVDVGDLKKQRYPDPEYDGDKGVFPYEGRERAVELSSILYLTKRANKYTQKKHRDRVATFNWLDWLAFFLPMVRWVRYYNFKSYLFPDIIAGLCVGTMVIPQGMSYATSAGVPSVYGLYGAFSPPLTYSGLGSSRQLAVGPVAVTSNLLHTRLTKIVPGSSLITNPNSPGSATNVAVQAQYNRAAVQMAFLVACLYTGLGVLRLGFLINFLSHAIIGGFISGNCIIIGLGQLKGILGISLPSPAPVTIQGLLNAYFSGMENLVWQTTVFGWALIIMMLTMRWIGGLHPHLVYVRAAGPITACIVGLIAQYAGNVSNYGIPTVCGSTPNCIPQGMPPITISWWTPIEFDLGTMFTTAVIIMFVDLLESTSIARALARKNNYVLAPNQEVVALGIANFVGAACNSYTTTGSFSRSAVNNAAGARTPLAQLISALLVGAVLLWLTHVFSNLPNCVLGAVIIAAMPALFEYEQLIYLWKVNKLDCLCWVASFLGVLFISVEIGLAIAVGLALLLVIWRSAFPCVKIIGRVNNTTMYRVPKQFSDVSTTPGILAFLIDSSIYYANHQYIKDTAESFRERYSAWSTQYGVSLAYVIIDFSAVLHMDSAGCHAIEDILDDFRTHNIQVVFANPSIGVVRQMELAGLPDLLGREWIFVSVHDAHTFCKNRLQEQGISAESQDASLFFK